MDQVIRGITWTCSDNVTAYQIIAQKRWTMSKMDPLEMGKWVFEGADASVKDVPFGFKNKGYEIVIAGQDFGGGGKSIEHPIVAMKGAGVKLVIAESFARYNFRNSINLGLPAIKCLGITGVFKMGDVAEVNLLTGEIKNLTTGIRAHGIPLTNFVLDLLEAGGLLEYVKN